MGKLASRSDRTTRPNAHVLARYFRATEGPLPSLLVVLPLVIAFEAGTRGWLGYQDAGPADQLVAFSLLRRAFDAAGATGAMLPAMTLAACLLGWHIAQRDPWSVRLRDLAGVWAEGALFALPIVVMAVAVDRWIPFAAATDLTDPRRLATLAVGAAVYEELLFRLLAFALLHGIAVDVLLLGRRMSAFATVFVTSTLFAASHHLGVEPFDGWTFAFRSMAGAIFGALFLVRGFGVTAVTHAVYDLAWIGVVSRSGGA